MKNEIYFKKSSIWIFWTVVALLAQFPERLALSSKNITMNYAIIFISAWFIWALLTPFILQLTRTYPFDRNALVKSSITQIVLILAIVTVHITIEIPIIIFLDWVFFQTPSAVFKAVVIGYILFSLFIRIFICSFILSIGHGIAYFQKLKKSELETSQLQERLSASQLESLRTQLQPHFLFNAHQTIIGLMLKNENEKAIKMVTRLSHLLRKSLEKSDNLIPLKQELEFVTLYLEIQQVRFQGRLTFVTEIQNEVLNAKVPSFILQPLVENAIKHGFETSAKHGLIELTGKKIDNRLALRVIDNGVGLKNRITEGIGLSNTKARLIQLFGQDYQFSLTNSNGSGTVAHVDIPFQE